MGKLFFAHQGRTIDKWVHYLDLYHRHFSSFRDSPVRMLEIGVFQGGSLELWRQYFGFSATIFGVDIDPDCAGKVSEPNQVRIGSQADPEFLGRVVGEMGGVDIVLDDGSHVASHQRISFETLFPLLNEGGLYVIEDLHTAYWRWYEGGYRKKGSAIELLKRLIDDMHHWWHDGPSAEIGAIHFYDSIAFIEKAAPTQPLGVRIGKTSSL